MEKTKVAVYGLTTEGYRLASRMVEKASVTIIDETLQMAMDLVPAIVKERRTLQELMGDEPLIGLKPVAQVLSEAGVVFFCPKLRKAGDDSIIEASGKVRDVAKNISRGSTLVNTLPTGAGGNADNIAVIEKQTGLKVGETLNYGYAPLPPRGDLQTVSVFAKLRDSATMEALGLKGSYGNIAQTELAYVSSVLNKSTAIATEVELMRKARPGSPAPGEGESYIDDLASSLYDLTAIQASEDVGEPLTYLAGAAVRSLDNEIRYVVEETRELLRELQLKASRTKVLVAWTVDRYEMRADRTVTAGNLVEKLRDYVTDVRQAQVDSGEEGTMDTYKHNLVIVCSSKDREWVKDLRKGARGHEVTVLNATPSMWRER